MNQLKSPLMRKIVVGLVLLAIAIPVGYWSYRFFASSKEASFACVATTFPYVIMEHKRAELSNLLENIKIDEDETKEPDLDAVDKAMKGDKPAPTKFFLSKDIDTKMLELADSIQNRPAEAPPLNGDDMTKFLAQLEPLFEKQAQAYHDDCKTLFRSIIRDCGSFSADTEESHSCRDKYDNRVNALLQKHLGSREALDGDASKNE